MKHLLHLCIPSMEDYYLSRIEQEFQEMSKKDGIDDAMKTLTRMMKKTKIKMEKEEPKIRKFIKIKEK